MITTQNRLLKYCYTVLFFVISALACTNTTSHDRPVLGKYKMYSDDPAVNRFLASEDNYIQLNNDNTIIYNTTINSKPKFNFKGTYTYDPASKTLTVKWSQGKLPEKLAIEKKGEENVIKIGETSYKREKPN